jgi:hypothetical protein
LGTDTSLDEEEQKFEDDVLPSYGYEVSLPHLLA